MMWIPSSRSVLSNRFVAESETMAMGTNASCAPGSGDKRGLSGHRSGLPKSIQNAVTGLTDGSDHAGSSPLSSGEDMEGIE